nr:hypothetical protein [Tanacetum cinerariifolium]
MQRGLCFSWEWCSIYRQENPTVTAGGPGGPRYIWGPPSLSGGRRRLTLPFLYFSGKAQLGMRKMKCRKFVEVFPIVRDQAKRKEKAGTSSTSSVNAFDVEFLAKLMTNEYAMARDPCKVLKGREMSELSWIKKQELELKAAELKI